MSAIVNVHEAKTHLSKLLARVAAGEEIVIARAGTPIAKLVPHVPVQKTRGYGLLKGQFSLPDSFFEPLPEEELAAWEGRARPPTRRRKNSGEGAKAGTTARKQGRVKRRIRPIEGR